MRKAAKIKSERGTNRSVSESFLFRSLAKFDEIVLTPFLLEKYNFVPSSFLNERVPPIPGYFLLGHSISLETGDLSLRDSKI